MSTGIGTLLAAFRNDLRGATTVLYALTAIPIATTAGAGIDYSRALATKTQLQTALDAAVLAGAMHAAGGRDAFALAMFLSQRPRLDGAVNNPTFALNNDGTYSATVTADVNNKMMSIVGIDTTSVRANSKASAIVYDHSCILTYGKGMAVGSDAMTFNGGSNLNLSGCTLQSDVSMVCNGHSAIADKSLAVGVSSKCDNAVSGAPFVPDIYAPIAANLTKECGLATYSGINWTPTVKPGPPNMITVVKADRTEYHVCGPLTLSGSGTMFGASPSADTIIVVENGGISVANKADIIATRTTFVLTASGPSSHTIDFPQGNGQSASLTVSPSKTSSNPWRGIAMYQDPSLTTNVDLTWGPGASVYVDGIMYFPNAALTMSGSGNSNSSNCTKLAVNKLTTNGSFNFSQNDSGCGDISLRQFESPPRLLY